MHHFCFVLNENYILETLVHQTKQSKRQKFYSDIRITEGKKTTCVYVWTGLATGPTRTLH